MIPLLWQHPWDLGSGHPASDWGPDIRSVGAQGPSSAHVYAMLTPSISPRSPSSQTRPCTGKHPCPQRARNTHTFFPELAQPPVWECQAHLCLLMPVPTHTCACSHLCPLTPVHACTCAHYAALAPWCTQSVAKAGCCTCPLAPLSSPTPPRCWTLMAPPQFPEMLPQLGSGSGGTGLKPGPGTWTCFCDLSLGLSPFLVFLLASSPPPSACDWAPDWLGHPGRVTPWVGCHLHCLCHPS